MTAIALEDQAQPRQMLSNVFNHFNPSQVIPYLANPLIPNLHQHPLILQGQQQLQLQDRPAQQMLQIEDRHASIFEDGASPFQPTQYAPTRRRLSHKQAVDYIPVRPPNPPQQPGSSNDKPVHRFGKDLRKVTIGEIEAVIDKYNEEHPNDRIKPPIVNARADRGRSRRYKAGLMDALKAKVEVINK